VVARARARHRLPKLLLRHGIVYYGGAAWTGKLDIWLRHEALPRLAGQVTRQAFACDYETVLAVKARRGRLDTAIEQLAAGSEFSPLLRRLGCLRGISTLTGFALAVEIGDWTRFTGASIGSFVGLTPAEYSSGNSRTLGPITKAGNGHVRRLLAEAVWHHRPCYRPDKPCATGGPWPRPPRRPGQPAAAPALGHLPRPPQTRHHDNVAIAVNWPAGAGRSPPSNSHNPTWKIASLVRRDSGCCGEGR
jgi:hypothetical protein